MAIKGAKVSDYGGKSLNAGDEHSQIFLDPEHKRTEQIKHWYDANPNMARAQSITMQRESNEGGQQRADNFKLIQEVLDSVQEDTQQNGSSGWNQFG